MRQGLRIATLELREVFHAADMTQKEKKRNGIKGLIVIGHKRNKICNYYSCWYRDYPS